MCLPFVELPEVACAVWVGERAPPPHRSCRRHVGSGSRPGPHRRRRRAAPAATAAARTGRPVGTGCAGRTRCEGPAGARARAQGRAAGGSRESTRRRSALRWRRRHRRTARSPVGSRATRLGDTPAAGSRRGTAATTSRSRSRRSSRAGLRRRGRLVAGRIRDPSGGQPSGGRRASRSTRRRDRRACCAARRPDLPVTWSRVPAHGLVPGPEGGWRR